MSKIRVLIADDNIQYRWALIEALSATDTLQVLDEASNGNEAVEKALALKPQVVLMDLHMPECNGVEATRRIQEEAPDVKVLVNTVSEKEKDLVDALKAGARGYLLKDEDPEQIVQAINYVARGGTIVSPTMAAKLLKEFKAQQSKAAGEHDSSLSRREREVLGLVAQGANNKQIASELFISENTVKTHLRNIMERLHVAKRTQAVAYAIRSGLYRPEDDEQSPQDQGRRR